jgi:hypothetical protein
VLSFCLSLLLLLLISLLVMQFEQQQHEAYTESHNAKLLLL